jgi:exopolysaccharide biosynthesis polyprenyl glycosylphosphotransferase
MKKTDSFHVLCSACAALADAVAIYAGFLFAVWLRFFSGWIPLYHESLPPMALYLQGAGIGALLFVFIFRSLGLYRRPQTGTFSEKIPRLVRATLWGILLTITLAFLLRTDPPFSRLVVAISFVTVSGFLLIERALFFRLELRAVCRSRAPLQRVALIGAGPSAVRLAGAIADEPRLRSRVAAVIPTPDEPRAKELDPALSRPLDGLEEALERGEFDMVILTDQRLSRERTVHIMLACERAMIDFYMVPDLFHLLTSGVAMQTIEGIPVLGVGQWPLDVFWNRAVKRIEDVVGAALGMVVFAPFLAAAAVLIKRESPGPVFYTQIRCGERGREFRMYKLRTMTEGAEDRSGPVWTSPDDPRRTRVGTWLRRWNLDELPQFWNVLKGDMSLVGPRPERPHFVEQFREDVSRYMWRHLSKPGMTGWAQVNGLRGQTSIAERITYDLYYLENWSLALDFKILSKTIFARENAY